MVEGVFARRKGKGEMAAHRQEGGLPNSQPSWKVLFRWTCVCVSVSPCAKLELCLYQPRDSACGALATSSSSSLLIAFREGEKRQAKAVAAL